MHRVSYEPILPRARDPGQRGSDRFVIAGARRVIAGKPRHGGCELLAAQRAQQRLRRRRAQRAPRGGEEIAFGGERHEIEPQARGRGAQAEAGIGAAGRDLLGDQQVGITGAVAGLRRLPAKRTPGRARSLTPRMRGPGRTISPCSRVTKCTSWCLRGSSHCPSAAAAAAARGRASATWKPASSHSPRASAGEAVLRAVDVDLEIELRRADARQLAQGEIVARAQAAAGRGSRAARRPACRAAPCAAARTPGRAPRECAGRHRARGGRARVRRAPRPRPMSTSGPPSARAAFADHAPRVAVGEPAGARRVAQRARARQRARAGAAGRGHARAAILRPPARRHRRSV